MEEIKKEIKEERIYFDYIPIRAVSALGLTMDELAEFDLSKLTLEDFCLFINAMIKQGKLFEDTDDIMVLMEIQKTFNEDFLASSRLKSAKLEKRKNRMPKR